jgi:outer membrane lipoprotein LolB
LLAEEVGWRLPIAEMQHWVRGGTAHPDAHVSLDGQGLPREIVEGGWRVEYKAFDAAQSPPLPTRIFAERAPYKVRLVVAEWRRE